MLVQLHQPGGHLMLLAGAVQGPGRAEPEGGQSRDAGEHTHDDYGDAQPVHPDHVGHPGVHYIRLRHPLHGYHAAYADDRQGVHQHCEAQGADKGLPQVFLGEVALLRHLGNQVKADKLHNQQPHAGGAARKPEGEPVNVAEAPFPAEDKDDVRRHGDNQRPPEKDVLQLRQGFQLEIGQEVPQDQNHGGQNLQLAGGHRQQVGQHGRNAH